MFCSLGWLKCVCPTLATIARIIQLNRINNNCSWEHPCSHPFLFFSDHPSAQWQALKYLQPQDQFTDSLHLALGTRPSGHVLFVIHISKSNREVGVTAQVRIWPRIWMSSENQKHQSDLIKLQRMRRKKLGQVKNHVWIKTRLINFWFKSSSKPSVCLVWWYNIKVQYLSTYDFEFTQGHRGNNAWFIGAESRSTQKLRKIIYSLLKSSEILVKILVKNVSWAQKGRTSHHSENTHRRMLDEERGITEIYNRSD